MIGQCFQSSQISDSYQNVNYDITLESKVSICSNIGGKKRFRHQLGIMKVLSGGGS